MGEVFMTEGTISFDQVYAEHYPRIYRYLIRMVGPKEAEDLAQEVFIKAGAALHQFRHEAQFSTWLYTIATNAAKDRMREPSFRRETIVEPLECEEPGSCPDKRFAVENNVLRQATNDCIRGIIEALPENYRVPVILSELEGLKNQEIAEIMGLSLEVVKARLHRGKARLKKELEKACQFSRDERNELTCDPK
jgi:RNA polymerase sigma-70 factor (ECF subfamily)